MSKNKLQKGSFSNASPQVVGRISKQTVELGECTFRRVIFKPGASWTKDLKATAGTDSCQMGHVGMVLKGELAIKMNDGEEMHVHKGEVCLSPPGHDAWVVGDEEVEYIEFSHGFSIFDTK